MVILLIIKGIANALTHTSSARIFAKEDDEDDKSLSEVLHQVGLGKLAARIHDHDRWGDILSSGEKQRIALARLILRRPKWIFLDETTSHLEEQEAIRLLRLVREKLPTSGVIMVTHQPGVWNLVDDICDISAVI